MLPPNHVLYTSNPLGVLELLQKPQIIAVVVADILDGVFHHRRAFNTQSKGETAPHIRVITAVSQYLWMDHPRPGDFQPPAVLAYRASRAIAQNAVGVHFHTRFGEREVRTADAHLAVRSVIQARELRDGAD